MVAPFELGAADAAAAIRTGDLTAQALAEALLARCTAAASLNALISIEPDRVRAAALRADQPRAATG
jgi:Asp-tRNA(Asn)/Glu-tRNA(Gln) amidotransferase A subunit family amidase